MQAPAIGLPIIALFLYCQLQSRGAEFNLITVGVEAKDADRLAKIHRASRPNPVLLENLRNSVHILQLNRERKMERGCAAMSWRSEQTQLDSAHRRFDPGNSRLHAFQRKAEHFSPELLGSLQVTYL